MEEFPDCMGVQSQFIGKFCRERQGRRKSGPVVVGTLLLPIENEGNPARFCENR